MCSNVTAPIIKLSPKVISMQIRQYGMRWLFDFFPQFFKKSLFFKLFFLYYTNDATFFLVLIFSEHRKIITLNAQLFDFNSECALKAMHEGLIIGGLNLILHRHLDEPIVLRVKFSGHARLWWILFFFYLIELWLAVNPCLICQRRNRMKFENCEEIFLVSHCLSFLCVNGLFTLSTQLVSAF